MDRLIQSINEARTPGHALFLELRAHRIQRLRTVLDEFFPEPGEVTLEIGCGHGHYLTAFAHQHPDARCIGVDLVTRRITKARQKAEKRNLQNLLFLKAEVGEFLEAWPPRFQLGRVFILFPDPWPKKRHIKNRILQTGLLDQLRAVAKPGTPLHFRTDHEATFAWGMEVIARHSAWHLRDDLEWPFENPSFFQDLLGHYQSLTAVCQPGGDE